MSPFWYFHTLSSFHLTSNIFFLNPHLRTCLLILERGEERERERERNINWLPLPQWRPNQQPRYVPWPGIKPIWGMMLQPTEPHWPGQIFDFFSYMWLSFSSTYLSPYLTQHFTFAKWGYVVIIFTEKELLDWNEKYTHFLYELVKFQWKIERNTSSSLFKSSMSYSMSQIKC